MPPKYITLDEVVQAATNSFFNYAAEIEKAKKTWQPNVPLTEDAEVISVETVQRKQLSPQPPHTNG